MTGKQILLAIVLLDFTGFTAWVLWEHGYVGFLELALANPATIQVAVDLVIALSFVLVWMWQDARSRGVSPVPYALLTLVLGSIGPLLYLVLRPEESSAAAHSRLAATTR